MNICNISEQGDLNDQGFLKMKQIRNSFFFLEYLRKFFQPRSKLNLEILKTLSDFAINETKAKRHQKDPN